MGWGGEAVPTEGPLPRRSPAAQGCAGPGPGGLEHPPLPPGTARSRDVESVVGKCRVFASCVGVSCVGASVATGDGSSGLALWASLPGSVPATPASSREVCSPTSPLGVSPARPPPPGGPRPFVMAGWRFGGAGTPVRRSPGTPHLGWADRSVCFD